tara:strand:+ start:147 stop:944 length:798 start_codon:yes stop_codon:yes gene_type:complete
MKIFLQNLIKKFFLILGLGIYKGENNKSLLKIIKKFKPYNLGYNLIRIGSKHDGGYLIPNILEKIEFCISPGVDKTVSFERQLLDDYNINSFLLDHTVEADEKFLKDFDFTKKKLSVLSNDNEISLEDFYNQKIKNKSNNGILQMDIEGDEYKVLLSTPDSVLKKFKILVIEFHDLDKINNKFNYSIINSLLDKLLNNFSICHIHPNNFSKKINFYKNVYISEILEVSFLRQDLVLFKEKIKYLPHPLDSRNVTDKKDINLKNFI